METGRTDTAVCRRPSETQTRMPQMDRAGYIYVYIYIYIYTITMILLLIINIILMLIIF